jgi:hypothetical protein
MIHLSRIFPAHSFDAANGKGEMFVDFLHSKPPPNIPSNDWSFSNVAGGVLFAAPILPSWLVDQRHRLCI